MKYQVQIKYTNPAHEHVSLRRRVDTVNRIVEAASEDEALNRAANQQRALGYLIREAAVVKAEAEPEEISKKKKKVIGDDNEKTDVAASGGVKEGFDPEPSDIAAQLVKKHGKGKVTKDHVDAYERDRDSNKAIDKEAVMKHVQKMSEEIELDEAQKKLKPSYWKAEWRLGTQSEVDKNNKKIFDKLAKTDPVKASAFHDNLMRMKKKDVKEDVEQVDEANMRFDYEAAARPKSSDVKNFLNRDKNPRAAAASKKYIRRMTKLGGLGPNQTKKDTEAHMKAHFEEVVAEASKEGKDVMRGMRASLKSMDLRHGVDSDKREAGYKMSPAVKAAQAKSDVLSKVVKRPQAGTLAAVHKSMEREMERSMKKEEVEQVDEGIMKNLKKAHVEYRSAHRAKFGKDPTVKSAIVTGIAKLAGAKTKTARKVGALVGGKPVSKQQQAAAVSRVGKMRVEAVDEKMTKGKKAAEKMSVKAAESRKKNIEGSANKVNVKPTMDLNKTGEK